MNNRFRVVTKDVEVINAASDGIGYYGFCQIEASNVLAIIPLGATFKADAGIGGIVTPYNPNDIPTNNIYYGITAKTSGTYTASFLVITY